MRQSQRRRCQNIDVMRGAKCHTDHKIFRARVVCGSPKSFRKLPVERPPGRFDVSCLKGDCVDEQGKMTTKGLFVNGVSRRLQAVWNQEGSVEEKWTLLKTALTDAAQSTLGTQKRRSPDWFAENSSKLLPLYEQRNKFYLRYINTDSEEDRNNFKRARKEARRATREAKNQRFVMKAKEAQEGRNGGKVVWKYICDIQSYIVGACDRLTAAATQDRTGQVWCVCGAHACVRSNTGQDRTGVVCVCVHMHMCVATQDRTGQVWCVYVHMHVCV